MNRIEEDIRSGQYQRVYLLYGPERYLKNYYKNRLKNALIPEGDTINLNVYNGKDLSVDAVIGEADTMPFFADHRLLVIEDSGWFKSGSADASARMAKYLENVPEETVILFVEEEVDARGKLFKTIKKVGCLMEMAHLKDDKLQGWILKRLAKNGKKIQRSAMDLFMERAGDDMENISNEMEKLIAYTYGRDAITLEDVEQISTIRLENRIFDMIDALAQKQQTRALQLYYDLLALKEPPMRILVLIGRQFNQLLQVKELREQGFDRRTIAEKLEVRDFIVGRALRQADHFTMQQCMDALNECVLADERVKSGSMNDRLAVEVLIMRVSK